MHGTGALFAAAYGNVGSSIYYALGVVALYALGLTPITFMIAGVIFIFTAASYGGDRDVPRGGRLLELRPTRLQRAGQLLRGLGADADLHHHDRDLGLLRAALPGRVLGPAREGPGDVIGAIILIAGLAALNVKGTQESARLNLVLAIADLATQIVLVAIGFVLVLSPDTLVSQVELGTAPTWETSCSGSRWG